MRDDALSALSTVQNRKFCDMRVSRVIPEAVSERFGLVLGNKFDIGARRTGIKLRKTVLLAMK